MHQKVNVLILLIHVQKWLFWKKKKKKNRVFPFSCLHLLFPPKKKIHENFITTIFLCHSPCLFLPENLFCLSHGKTRRTMSMNNVGHKICLFGTSNFMVTRAFFSLGVHRSGSGTSSTANHKILQGHGTISQVPWC